MDAKVDKTLKITTPSDLEIAMTRVFDAPRHLVFDAMTTPEHVKRWFGCAEFALPVCEIDLRAGGAYRFIMRSPDGVDSTLQGIYREVARPERVVFTERFSMPGFTSDEYQVTSTFVESGGSTTLTSIVSFNRDVPLYKLMYLDAQGAPKPVWVHSKVSIFDDVYAGVLEGIAKSLKLAGFKTICLIADHGGSARPQAELAQKLSREWAADGVKVISVDDYYGAAGEEQSKLLIAQGETPKTIGQHAGISDTSELMAVHPQGVDLTRLASFPFPREPTGADGDARRASAERGRVLIALKVESAVRQIRALSPGM